jgi:hypothetical protein
MVCTSVLERDSQYCLLRTSWRDSLVLKRRSVDLTHVILVVLQVEDGVESLEIVCGTVWRWFEEGFKICDNFFCVSKSVLN